MLIDHICDECSDHFAKVKNYLETVGIEYNVDPYIVRGLDYYTKTVFEIIAQNKNSNNKKKTSIFTYDMIKDKRSFVVVISQTYCSHCIAYKPIYNEVLKEHNAKGYDLDIVDLELEEREDILEEYDIEGTPTTIIFIDGILQKERKVGLVEKAELQSYLAMYGFI